MILMGIAFEDIEEGDYVEVRIDERTGNITLKRATQETIDNINILTN